MESKFNNLTNFKESVEVLQKSRAVTLMANKLLVLDDEMKCYEEVGKLLLDLFTDKKCSFALMTNNTKFTVIDCRIKNQTSDEKPIRYLVHTGSNFPLKGTAVNYCAETLRSLHARCGSKSTFADHKVLYASGMNSFVNTPFLLGGKKFAGCLNVASEKNNFTDYDIILIQDIAAILGAQIYAKRLQKAEQKSHTVSKALLHSLIPETVLSEIEHYWSDKNEAKVDASEGNIEKTTGIEQQYNENKRQLEMLRNIRLVELSTSKFGHAATICKTLKYDSDQSESGLLRSNGISNLTMISTDFDSPHHTVSSSKNDYRFKMHNNRISTGYKLLENIACLNSHKISTALYACVYYLHRYCWLFKNEFECAANSSNRYASRFVPSI